jgi:CubicO group peptidase (beta-lactamase class C family)
MYSKKLRQTSWLPAILVILCLIQTCPGVRGEDKQQQFTDYLMHAENELGFSGSILIIKDGSILLAKGYGLANREMSTPNTAETKFLLCSITKPLTAIAIMQLVDRGELGLDDPITKFLPRLAGSLADNITVYNLLTQTSGIVDYLSLVDSSETFVNPVLIDQVISMFMEAPLEFEPGTKWQYSNSNYYLLGKIIEIVSGIAYDEYMHENVFKPHGMKNSGFAKRYLNDLAQAATGYRIGTDGKLTIAPAVHSSWPYAAGGLYSTALDMAKLDMALRNETFLSEKSKDKMYTPFRWRYGCGWEIDTLYGHQVVSHGGTGGGYCSMIVRFVDTPICMVALGNNEDAFRDVSKIAYDLAAIEFGQLKENNNGDTLVYVDPKILEEYAGDYELAPGAVFSFMCRDGQLTEFYLKVVEGSVQFIRDSSGTVNGIIIRQGGRNMTAKRIR